MDHINQYYNDNNKQLIDGYAPFCKHIFIPNFIGSLCTGYTSLNDTNRQYLLSDYQSRTEYELPVLTRWLDKKYVDSPRATHLDIILYSREQINKEHQATQPPQSSSDSTNTGNEQYDNVYDTGVWQWGIISIKPQLGSVELPMLPITIMRNSMISEGGSGVDIDRSQYHQSVEFWKKHANIA